MRIIVDMSKQQAGAMFADSTDWYYNCEPDAVNAVLEAFEKLGIPARCE